MGSFNYWQYFHENYQLVHAFNSIQYTNKPWFITFEDHRFLYRNPKNKAEAIIYKFLNERLTLQNCQKLIAISDYAKMRFFNRIQDWSSFNQIKDKVVVIPPNFSVRVDRPKTYKPNDKIQLVFVGNHFARKGGIVALRLAKKAEILGLPINIHIISGLKHGAGVPTDYPDISKYADDLKLLDLSNVSLFKNIANEQVLHLLSQSHFQILATLHDTYGYSIIEGFSVATPAITTNICALPEFVHHGENGYHLELPVNEIRHWGNWMHGEKTKTDEYWEIVNSTYDYLAEEALKKILQFLDKSDKQEHYEYLSTGALTQMKNFHDAEKHNELFDNLYAAAAN
ncbi:glycosyltransferase family 4 protein [Tolypothrix sp. FACHB-123]|uniref:glycosyltransferase family 4 protein n=1 Tax=Tolypothrix sp. FACHB-123 TaxID=2692868 RepID=UPI001F5554DF|nr:glycosyltransferase family 4 protein [Tolypothrix sp. FACHB-123]